MAGSNGAVPPELRLPSALAPELALGEGHRDDADHRPGRALKGRGVACNPPNRFESRWYEIDADAHAAAEAQVRAGSCDSQGQPGGRGSRGVSPAARDAGRRPATTFHRDPTRRALTTNRSPDVPFDVSLNPYRGCEHGCVYCYARPGHEFLGLSAGLDFETKILVKEDAPKLLRKELSARSWTPQLVGISGVTDAYQPVERRLELTRRCLQVFAEFRNPVGLVTKNALVVRDIDVLSELAAVNAVSVKISVTTLDPELQRRMEPRAAHPLQRLRAVRELSEAGIPVGVMIAPIVPGLTDAEVPALIEAAAAAGARSVSYILLRLPHGLKDLFEKWLQEHYPERRDKVLSRIRAIRGGALNDATFGRRMRGQGLFADQTQQLFDVVRRRNGLAAEEPALSTDAFRSPANAQLSLL